MTTDVDPFERLKNKARFSVSLRFELFYSLGVLLDPESRIHQGWKQQATAKLGQEFFDRLSVVGHAWQIWVALPTLLPADQSEFTFEEVEKSLSEMEIRDWQEKLLFACLHFPDLVTEILEGKCNLKRAINKSPKRKKEWFSFTGLYPYDEDQPIVQNYESLIARPDQHRQEILSLLCIYWDEVFRDTWRLCSPALERSAAAKERLFAVCTFEEFTREALLRVELDTEKGVLHAVRGGEQNDQSHIEQCTFSPSAFNDRRVWSALKSARSKTDDCVFFPYFDPEIQLDLVEVNHVEGLTSPEIDAFLVFKALGDSTRFAIAGLMAQKPRSATELASLLEVSKPTISHHLEAMRSANLLREEPEAGSVKLTLVRETIEKVSGQAIGKLFHSDNVFPIKRSRRQKTK